MLRPWRSCLLLAFYLLRRREDCVERVSFHPWTEFDNRALADFVQQALEDLASQIGMGHFAAAEEDGGLYFVALFEEAEYVVLFELVIVLIGIGPKLHFFNRDVLLMFLRFVKLLIKLVKVFSVIHDSADRRVCSWRNLYQIQAAFLGDF